MILPDEVITIGAYAFAGCSSLEKYKICQKVEVIEIKLFMDVGL